LTYQLARNLLYQKGVRSEWLLKGIGAQMAIAAGDRQTQQALSSTLTDPATAAEYAEMDLLTVGADELLSNPAWLSETSLAWDSIVHLIATEGWPSVVAFLEKVAETDNVPVSFDAAFDRTLNEFEQEWRALARNGYVEPGWAAELTGFDGEQALDHVSVLGHESLAGRQAGTPGAELAAGYIARQFAEYGLQPAGDLYPDSYMQTFTITYTERLREPALQILGDPPAYAFREQFLSLYSTLDPAPVQGELIWLDNSVDAELDLSDKIALAMPGNDVQAVLDSAVDHHASGLLLLGTKKDETDLYGKQPLGPSILAEIPVLELTLDGSLRLLETLGQTFDGIKDLPAGAPLEHGARLDSAVSAKGSVRTSNVLGLLPGSDPLLSQQVIILGAHYDHVGDDPAVDCPNLAEECRRRIRYSGLNDNASGVAVLLEIARYWNAIGYRPKHSVLFAAWGAQEAGELGSSHYIQAPAMPLSNTIAMLQLDGVAGGEGFYPGLQANPQSDGYVIHHFNEAAEQLGEKIVEVASYGESDHLPFSQLGIPVGLISWRLANEDNLPDELAPGVSVSRMETTGRLTALALMAMAR
jgi:hypothetical protein